MSWRANVQDALRPLAERPRGSSPWSQVVHGYPVATWALVSIVGGILFVVFVMIVDDGTGGTRAQRRRARVLFILWLACAALYVWQVKRMV